MTMWSAIFLRMTDMGSISPGVPANLLAEVAATGADEEAAAGCAAWGAGWLGAVFCFSTKAWMSSLVMRPPMPVPRTLPRSTLASFASLRTRGEVRMGSPLAETTYSSASAAGAWGAAACGAGAEGAGAGVFASGAGVAAPADPPMVATTVLTWTVAPAWTLISLRTPVVGEGISASTLSVEISKRGSSRWTVSPTFLSHLVIVPSKMDSPIWGMTTSVLGPAGGTEGAEVLGAAELTPSGCGAGAGG